MEEKEQNQFRLISVSELEFWIEAIENMLLKKHAIKGSKKDRFNWVVRACCSAVRNMGHGIDFTHLNIITVNGIDYVKKEFQNCEKEKEACKQASKEREDKKS